MITNMHTKPFFELEELWTSYVTDDFLRQKIEWIKRRIPLDAASILDLGCGNGLITNELAASYDIVGVDRSRRALRRVSTKAICSDIACVGIKTQSFDLVLCSEVLEHLPDYVLRKAASEIERTSKKYAFVTVPYKENIRKNFLKCPKCGFEFNASYHLHSFDLEKLKGLFQNYDIKASFLGGRPVRQYVPLLLTIKHRLANRWARLKTKGVSRCPQCGNTAFPEYRHNLVSVLCDGLNKMFLRRQPYWLFVLFEKRRTLEPC